MTAALWPAFLVNFLFWSGVAIGVPVFVAVLDLSHAKWPTPLRDVAVRFCRFLPAAFVTYLGLFGAAGTMRVRDAVALAAAFGVAFSFGRRTLRASALPGAITLLIVYAAAFSLVSVDLIMSLEPDWVSTLFPAYVFTTNVYAGIAALAVAASIILPAERFNRSVTRDLGAVLLGFALIWIYFTWTQFLVIWYGNLPTETRYIAERTSGGWQWVAWMVVIACGLVPALALMPQFGRRRIPLAVVSGIILSGYWVECWLFVKPAMPASTGVLGTVAVTAGFALLFAACIALPRRRPSSEGPPPPAEAHAA